MQGTSFCLSFPLGVWFSSLLMWWQSHGRNIGSLYTTTKCRPDQQDKAEIMDCKKKVFKWNGISTPILPRDKMNTQQNESERL